MENDNIIRLNFEDGEYGEFEILDSIEYEGNEYVVLLSATIPTRQMKSLYSVSKKHTTRTKNPISG